MKPDYVPTNECMNHFQTTAILPQFLNLRDSIKLLAIELWDEINKIPHDSGDPQSARYVALAKTELEATAMWATKALSRL